MKLKIKSDKGNIFKKLTHNLYLYCRSRTPTPEPPPLADLNGDGDIIELDSDVRDTYKLPSPLPLPIDEYDNVHDLRVPSPPPQTEHDFSLNFVSRRTFVLFF